MGLMVAKQVGNRVELVGVVQSAHGEHKVLTAILFRLLLSLLGGHSARAPLATLCSMQPEYALDDAKLGRLN